jgi:hypothetical protein
VVCKWTNSRTTDWPAVFGSFLTARVLEDCRKRSCWKNSIGVSVPRPYRMDVYVCSKSFWLSLTVVYSLLNWNTVSLWTEPPSTLKYNSFLALPHFHYEHITQEQFSKNHIIVFLNTQIFVMYFSHYTKHSAQSKCIELKLDNTKSNFWQTLHLMHVPLNTMNYIFNPIKSTSLIRPLPQCHLWLMIYWSITESQ